MDYGPVKDRASTAEAAPNEPLEEAHALFGEHKYREAMSKVLKLLKEAPNEPDLLLFAAACFFHLKDYKSSIRFNERIVTLSQTAKALSGGRGEDWHGLAQVYANLANAHKAAGNAEKAVEMYKKSLEHKPKDTPKGQQARWLLLLEADQLKSSGRKSPASPVSDIEDAVASPRVALQVSHTRASLSAPPPQQSPSTEAMEGGSSSSASGKVHRDRDATDPSANSSKEPGALIEGELMIRRSRSGVMVSFHKSSFKHRVCSLWRVAPQVHELRSSAKKGGEEMVLPWARVASWRGTDTHKEILLICAQPEETFALRASSHEQYDAWRRAIVAVLRERRNS